MSKATTSRFVNELDSLVAVEYIPQRSTKKQRRNNTRIRKAKVKAMHDARKLKREHQEFFLAMAEEFDGEEL